MSKETLFYKLSPEEDEKLKIFLKRSKSEVFEAFPSASKWLKVDDQKTALKFLIPKKFDVDRAIEVMIGFVKVHEEIPNWTADSIRDYLIRGPVTVIPEARDKEGRAIFFIQGKKYPPEYIGDWQTQVKATFFLMSPLLEAEGVALNGFTTVLDFRDMPFRMDNSQKPFFDALQNKFPAKLKNTYVVNPPWFFKILYKVISVFLKKKVRERTKVISLEELSDYISKKDMPEWLGGTNKFNVEDWLKKLEASGGLEISGL